MKNGVVRWYTNLSPNKHIGVVLVATIIVVALFTWLSAGIKLHFWLFIPIISIIALVGNYIAFFRGEK